MKKSKLVALALVASVAAPAFGLVIEGFDPDEQVVYKNTEQGELKLHIFNPENHTPSDRRPVAVFFFGGGWVSASITQFYPHCDYLASRGIVAIAAEYRVGSLHNTTPRECVIDGKSAIRWVRAHANELGIDPDRIVAGGGSAGGQIAAATGTVTGFEEEGEDLGVSSRPDALALFNPVYDNGPDGFGYETVQEYWEEFSPMHNISETTPPTVVFLGTADALIPVATAEEYKRRMEENGRRCDLHLYEGETHGFFNYDPTDDSYTQTVIEMDLFLASLGYLTGPPTLPAPSALPEPAQQGPIVYLDATMNNSTLETSGALVLGDNYTQSGGQGSGSDTLWHERTRAVNGGTMWTAQAGVGTTETPERIVTQFTLTEAGMYNIYGYLWNGAGGTGLWDCGFQLGSGSNVKYTKANTMNLIATSGHFTTAVIVDDGAGLMEASLGTWNTATDGFTVTVYADGGFAASTTTDNRTWYDGVGYTLSVLPPVVSDVHFMGIDFNRDDALGSPSQSLFRIISGSTIQASNTYSYTRTIGSSTITVSQPGSVGFEFRGANSDSTRAIPGGDISTSFLVSDFIATREGGLEISMVDLPAGDYIFQSFHLDTYTGSDLGFAQGSSASTPNTIVLRIDGELKDYIQPTALGSAGLNTTFIDNDQVPTLAGAFSHDGLGPVTITLSSTETNAANNYLLLNGFELRTLL